MDNQNPQAVETPETENKVETKAETPTTENKVETKNEPEQKPAEPFKVFASQEEFDDLMFSDEAFKL